VPENRKTGKKQRKMRQKEPFIWEKAGQVSGYWLLNAAAFQVCVLRTVMCGVALITNSV